MSHSDACICMSQTWRRVLVVWVPVPLAVDRLQIFACQRSSGSMGVGEGLTCSREDICGMAVHALLIWKF